MRRARKAVINGDSLTPISIFQSLKGEKKCLLESSLKHKESGRYSFIAASPYAELIGEGNKTTFSNYVKKTSFTKEDKPLKVLEKLLKSQEITPPEGHPFAGGAIGYIGYDAIRLYEDIGAIPKDELEMPDVHLMFYDTIVMYDHKRYEVTITVLNPEGHYSDEELDVKLEKVLSQLTDYGSIKADLDQLSILEYTSNIEHEDFLEAVKIAKSHIKRGDIFQIVLSQRLSAPFTGSPFSFYRKLRQDNPSPYMFFIQFDGYTVLGASPESLIKVEGRDVTTNPIAGTRKRGATEEEDQLLEEELLKDEKELAEHRMLVDLGRNDLGKVCEIGTVELTKYMTVEKYQHVMHIVSEVKGKLAGEMSGLEALVSTLPAGTVSGAPKIRAMQLLNELETVKRGVYSGAVGYVGFDGNLDFALAIRTMVIKDQTAHVQAGAGVVYDSVPELEFQETLNKARSLLEVKS
ncbi:anthranilate synthase component I [Jeotgalibacillus proteolyticus]|uniref:Anthranilate synthase component 1 n=1 Tax=Jeotgalibacillus proteolyticus TaxID=2082395 RepID=A0A2S5GHM8_9BACL|nr:anthranilate synthase component I [Jeotgalibacillus proteolyticus]PPA72468.1 anthranilate synthase component I [Jeotgalibacillus proteolyticus]